MEDDFVRIFCKENIYYSKGSSIHFNDVYKRFETFLNDKYPYITIPSKPEVADMISSVLENKIRMNGVWKNMKLHLPEYIVINS